MRRTTTPGLVPSRPGVVARGVGRVAELDVRERRDSNPRPPEGLILHSAGPGEQGYYVYDIWESQEAFERFMEEKLGPALGEVMGGPPPEGGAPQYFPIEVLIIPR